ncbi:NTPase (NACHT family) [filamentous cyanobacterium CCP2]|nr:NTPase (NACHT family) [filamentous cyanobacterium CCP2]
MTGGVAGGGFGAFWSLFRESDVPKAIVSFLIGLGISYGASLLDPLHKGNKRRLEQTGQALDGAIEENIKRLIAGATKAEDAYLLAQALTCQDYKSEGMGARNRISIPMLQEVFVPLQLDSSAIAPGLNSRSREAMSHKEIEQWQKAIQETCIWDYLVEVKQQPAYRQLAIVAWGGYGKTTLLKHLAYTYGMKQQGKFGVTHPLVPVLLPLRNYKDLLTGENPPTLPELVMQNHLKQVEIAELSARLKNLPANWFETVLTHGNGLVMMDGFDEVPENQRLALSRWINTQMGRFNRSVFVLTSRPIAYNENYIEPLRTKLWVRPFQPKQQEAFVRQWYLCQEKLDRGGRNTPDVQKEAERNAENLLRQINDPTRPGLADLAKNPLLLNLLASYHRSDPGAELPRQRAELYQDICTLQLRKRPEARDVKLLLPPNERQLVLQQVALTMMQRELRLVPESELLQWINRALKAKKHRVDPETFLRQIIEVSELIVRQGLEGCEFSHLSFQEFLAAAQIKTLNQEEKWLYPHLQAANTNSAENQSWWRQTILLYAAQTNPAGLIQEAIRQGATDLAYACYQETQYTLDEEFEAEVKALKPAVQASRYATLEAHLQAQRWKEADEETYCLMITTVGKEEGQYFESEELLNFPCEDLKTIDSLWVKYSNGHFGFSVQKKIYVECGAKPNGYDPEDEIWEKFCNRVGWRANGKWLDYDNLNPSLSSQRGIFPFLALSSLQGVFPLFFFGGVIIFSRTEACRL